MVDKSKSIFVEYCINCSNHAWCTKHDESKYKNFYELVRQGLEQEFQDFMVYGNYNANTGKTLNPRLGAFEIMFQDQLVFSKLKTSMWPTMEGVVHRIKLAMKGRKFSEYNEEEGSPQKKSIKLSNSSMNKRAPVRGRGKIASQNHSYLDVNAENGSYMGEFSMMQMSNKHQAGGIGLPYVNKNLMKREMTPTRLEGIGLGTHFFDEKQHVKLAYLDANKKIVNLTRENQFDFLQRKYETEITSPMRNAGTMYEPQQAYSSFMNTSNTNSPIYMKHTYSRGYQVDETQRHMDNYRKSGSVPISKRRHRGDDSGPEFYDSTLYTDKTMKTEESEQALNRTGQGKSKIQEKNTPEKSFYSKAGPGDKLPILANIKNQKNTLQGVFVFRGKIIQEKDLLGLESVNFPEQKFSEIKMPKEGVKKKKITMIPDTAEDCKIDIYTTTPSILAMEANDITVTKGSLFKIALKFGKEFCDGVRDCYIFLFKNNKPWLKILIQLSNT